MVTFHLFARPALAALQGASPEPQRARARLESAIARNPRRDLAVRCAMTADADGWRAAPGGEQGSHQLTSMLGADALALVPKGEGELAAGEQVDVELLVAGPTR
jgi:molybdopterin biosynthesis enzyme